MVTEILPDRMEGRTRSSARADAGPVGVRKTSTVRLTDGLAMSIARLLSIAVEISTKCGMKAGAGPDLPAEYRLWPCHRSTLISSGREVGVRFYVSPKGIVRALDDAFPVGTTLVVETAGAKEHDASRCSTTRFVMTKCASVTTRLGREREVWLHASYDGQSKRSSAPHPRCALCLTRGLE